MIALVGVLSGGGQGGRSWGAGAGGQELGGRSSGAGEGGKWENKGREA